MKSPALFSEAEYKYWIATYTKDIVDKHPHKWEYPRIVIVDDNGYIVDEICIGDFKTYASISILRKRDFDEERQFDLVINDEHKDPDELLGCAFFPDSFEEGQVYGYRALACNLCIKPYDTGKIEERMRRHVNSNKTTA